MTESPPIVLSPLSSIFHPSPYQPGDRCPDSSTPPPHLPQLQGPEGPYYRPPYGGPGRQRWLEGRPSSCPMGLKHRGQGMPRAGLGGGWTKELADQTARLYNLQPLSLDWNGAGGSPSISPPGGCSLPTGSPWVALGLLDLRFYLLSPSPSPIFVLSLLHSDPPAGRGCLHTSSHPHPPSPRRDRVHPKAWRLGLALH